MRAMSMRGGFSAVLLCHRFGVLGSWVGGVNIRSFAFLFLLLASSSSEGRHLDGVFSDLSLLTAWNTPGNI